MDTEKLYGPYIDDGYRTFSERLTRIHDRPYLGVRLPVLKRLAAGLDSIDFLVAYHEDVLLRGFWIARQKLPFAERRKLLEDHLQYLMTWGEADTLAAALRIGKGEKDEAYAFFSSLLSDERVMPRRLGIVTLMSKRALYPEKRYLIISYLGVTDHREAFDGYYARVDGRSLIMDRDSLLVEQEIFASDGGESVEEAELNALEKGARIAAGMLLKDI